MIFTNERDERIVERHTQREMLLSMYCSRALVGNASKILEKDACY